LERGKAWLFVDEVEVERVVASWNFVAHRLSLAVEIHTHFSLKNFSTMKTTWLLLPLSLCFCCPVFAQTDSTPSPKDQEWVFDWMEIETPPSFPGGERGLQMFLANNIRYPTLARNNNIQGNVAVAFVVNRDGSISDITILKDIGAGCGREVVRVIQTMPQWLPGRAEGRTVKVKYTLPVRFRLEGAEKPKKKRGLFGKRD
jgi:TonB family protein